MASLALGAAGAFVGSFFGPLGTSIGWMIGSAAGNMLFGKGQDGPRLTDLKLQNSSYGQMVPLVYGTVRITGNVIWQTDLKEHQQKSGGKGGPTVTTYTYSASFAVAICEGPILGVKSIWADSRLVYQPESGLSAENFPFTLYLGDETQLPDPTIESIEGVGNVNANRGIAFAVFTDKFLTDFGNRIPSLSFEVYTSTQGIPWRVSSFTPVNFQSIAGFSGTGPMNGSIENGELIMSDFGTPHISVPATTFPYTVYHYDFQGNLLSQEPTVTCAAPPGTETYLDIYPCSNNPRICWVRCNDIGPVRNTFYVDGALSGTGILNPGGGDDPFAINNVPAYGDGALYAAGGQGTGAYLCKWSTFGGLPLQSAALPGTSGSKWATAVDEKGDVWCGQSDPVTGDKLYHFDKDLNPITSYPASALPANFLIGSLVFTVWNGILYFASSGHGIAATIPNTPTDPGTISTALGTTISLGNGYALCSDGIISLNPRPDGELLADIVSDLSVKAGLLTSQLEVSELIDIVDGYVISQQASLRSMIEPLQTAYFFDAVESDTLAKFVKRGKDSEVTIPITDLGTHAKGSEPPPLITSMRVQEVDLPRSISAVYFAEEAEYQNGTQLSQRLTTSSELTVSLQLAIVMTDAKAKNITDALLYNAWLEREKITILLPRKWVYLEPTDVVTAAGYRVRLTEKSETVAGVIKFDGLVTSPFVFTQSAIAVPGLAPPPTPPPTSGMLTDLLMLDIPLVNDADAANGYYAAMAGRTAGSWPGATLFKSIDGGVNFDSLLVDTVPDTMGVTTTVLGNYTGGNTFDELNSVGVQLGAGAGALSSVSALEVLNGANECLIGNELLQFKSAVLTGPRAYTLSGLLRGRRGTEWAVAANPSGSRFCMLPTSTNVAGPFPEIFAARDFKAVTSGGTLASATDVPFTNNGVALRCYSPTAIGGGLNAAGDLAIQWIRRTRIGGTWQNFVDVPLSEATEAYVVQIWNATFTACARVITGITTPTVTYTSAQQVTDFGAQQQTIYVTVGQLGTLGLGVQSPAALQGAGSTIDAPLNPVPPYGSGPPVPPPAGSCVGTVFNTTLTWAVGDDRVDSPAGFVAGTNWVLKLTTPASGNFVGELDFFEHGGPPCLKTGTLSKSACGVPLLPVSGGGPLTGMEIALYFCLGTPFFPGLYCQLEYATDYYFSLQTSCGGVSAYELHIYNN